MNPLKQGLKPLNSFSEIIFNRRVKEVNPLKQGLKRQTFLSPPFCIGPVKEVNPLKQGLKQLIPLPFHKYLL